jgi:hypothetical protein
MIRLAKVYDAALMFGHLHAFKESGNSMQFTAFLWSPGITPRLWETLKQGQPLSAWAK